MTAKYNLLEVISLFQHIRRHVGLVICLLLVLFILAIVVSCIIAIYLIREATKSSVACSSQKPCADVVVYHTHHPVDLDLLMSSSSESLSALICLICYLVPLVEIHIVSSILNALFVNIILVLFICPIMLCVHIPLIGVQAIQILIGCVIGCYIVDISQVLLTSRWRARWGLERELRWGGLGGE